ncbi:PAS domain S-box-containing protein [Jatrophihabitans sp. GAS493]|uniref:PAS domain S-box protein n=1 Tax=Jatrophihabitans sp. GAS493 TaxID=1907575 RepID=UPI000BB8E2EE|nr:PAS domain S-box protein [Jatrophihabitans sp. GAS493]SOD71433.1 PAS domain S-box-containing protein [Jatrophihabitans sp. GAS493]
MSSNDAIPGERRTAAGREPAPEARVDHGLTAVVATTFSGVVTYWSDGAQRLYGLPRRGALGQNIASLIDWHIAPDDLAHLAQIGEGGVRVFRHPVRLADGKHVHFKSTASVAAGPDGALEIIFASSPLPASTGGGVERAGAPSGLEAVAEMRFFCDETMKIEYVGASLTAIFGYLPRDVIGLRAPEFIFEDDLAAWMGAWNAAISDPGQSHVAQVRVRHSNGQWLWIEESIVSKLDDPEVASVVVNARNVSDLRRTEDVLAAAEQTLLSVLETSVEGVWIVDAYGTTIFANERLAEFLGISRNRILQSRLEQLDDIALCRMVREQNVIRLPGAREQLEGPFAVPGEGTRWLRVAMAPRYDHLGAFAGSIVMCSEVTEQRGVGTGPLSRLLGAAPTVPVPLGQVPPRAGSLAPQLGDEQQVRSAVARSLTMISPRELEVVVRLVMGDRVPAIAERLFVSQSTVRNQLSSVFRKVGVKSQQDLIALLRGDIEE